MTFTADRKALKMALDNANQACKKSPSAFTSCILGEIHGNLLTITGYDLETGIITSIDIDVPMGEESTAYSFLAESARFNEIIGKQAADTVECIIDDAEKTMIIKCGKSKCKIQILDADGYPSIPETDGSNKLSIAADVLLNMIRQTVFAVSTSDNKPILTGECFNIENGTLEIAAIDGFRMAVREETISLNLTEKFVVKSDALRSVIKLIKGSEDITIISSKKHVVFDLGATKLFSRLLEGEFHNYKGSIPTSSTTEVLIPTKPLIMALERFLLFTNDKNKAPACLEINSGKILMELKSGLGEAEEIIDNDVDFSGSPIRIGCNCKYMLEALKASECDRVKILFNGPLSPMTIKPLDGNSFTYLVLPVRLKSNT